MIYSLSHTSQRLAMILMSSGILPINAQEKNSLMPLTIRKVERANRAVTPTQMGKVLGASAEVKEVIWESEQLSSRALVALKNLVNQKKGSGDIFADDFSGMSPVPEKLKKVETSNSGWELWVADEKGADQKISAEGFVKSLREDSMKQMQVKIVGVELAESQVQTEVFVEYAGDGRQATAKWICHWQREKEGELRLQKMARSGYQELRGKQGVMFRDATSGVLGEIDHFSSQVQRGIADWAGEITRFSDLALTGHHGIAVGDVDNDGLEDVFVCDGGGLPNRLYRQRADGTAEDISAKAGVDWYEDSRSALLIDLDNDGDQDLVVATIAMITFSENNGSGIFTLRGGFPGAQYPFSMGAADYDLDGDLDLYVCLYGEADNAAGGRGFDSRSPVPFEDAQNGGRNVLLKNLGNFAFADVTDEVGLGEKNNRWSFAAAWEDYDRDGDSDLYVANDFGRNTLYRNDGGFFVEVADKLGVEDTAAGMSVAWGDYNRDGKFDLYVGNMFSAAGSRVSRQDRFSNGRRAQSISNLQRMARGNSLFAGGGEAFQEVSGAVGAEMGRWAWSSGFVDINNDGWEDLVIANGYLTGWETKKDL